VNTGLPALNPAREQRLRRREFDLICRTMYERFGIDLEGKEVLVAARLGKKLRELGLSSFEQYWKRIEQDASGESLTAMVDALTTNHTSFFRETQHFDYLRATILPSLKQSGQIRLWSAACSTGEEPYSIAFTSLEALGAEAARKVQILATDISTRVLAVAERGIYPAERFRSREPAALRSFLLKGSGDSAGHYCIRKEVRSLVSFRRLNLMEDFSPMGMFHVIFCRNVMIYFDQKTQESLVKRLTERLEPGGHLLIGHAESLNGIRHELQYVCPATYHKPSAPLSAFRRRRAG
jgi:chemotaxis protein methyltransferase CheR